MAEENTTGQTTPSLDFEAPIVELERRIKELESFAEKSNEMDLRGELDVLRKRLAKIKQETFSKLTEWQRVRLARAQGRPGFSDYVRMMADDFYELHGDRCFGEDPALATGFARLGSEKILLMGNRKGKTTQDRIRCNFGSAHPEGYRKALQKMRLAEKFGLPIVSLINTPGAFPGVGAEERGQAMAIAVNIFEMFRIKVPIIVVVIGEGGSGGALGIGIGDRVFALENSYYSVISPEGCSAILWKSAEKAPQAADALKLTPQHLIKFKIIDEIIPEPPGGAHREPEAMAAILKKKLIATLQELKAQPQDKRLDLRYQKFRHIGFFEEAETGKKA